MANNSQKRLDRQSMCCKRDEGVIVVAEYVVKE